MDGVRGEAVGADRIGSKVVGGLGDWGDRGQASQLALLCLLPSAMPKWY